MFRATYMSDVLQVDVALCSKCNAWETYSNDKGYALDMFCMWLVQGGIANLMSLPTLERDRYVHQYHTNSAWIVEYPDVPSSSSVIKACARVFRSSIWRA